MDSVILNIDKDYFFDKNYVSLYDLKKDTFCLLCYVVFVEGSNHLFLDKRNKRENKWIYLEEDRLRRM